MYKVGDKIKIVSAEYLSKRYGFPIGKSFFSTDANGNEDLFFHYRMWDLCGKEYEISHMDREWYGITDIDFLFNQWSIKLEWIVPRKMYKNLQGEMYGGNI